MNALRTSRPVDAIKQNITEFRKATGDTEPWKAAGPSKPRKSQPEPKPAMAPIPTTPPTQHAPLFERLQASMKRHGVAPAEAPTAVSSAGSILADIASCCAPSVPRKSLDTSASNPHKDPNMATLAREGGVNFINMLLAAAISTSKPVQEWTFRDVLAFQQDKKEKWLGPKGAYHKELEALRQHGVFGPLVDLPKGQKAIVTT
jgi:hypothetical protein